MRSATARGPQTMFRWDGRDAYFGATFTALVGTLGAVLLGIFGLPGLDLHTPFLHDAGIMDPLCGMTRAVHALASVELRDAWRYNPGSFALAVFGAGFVLRGLIGLVTGRWLRFPRFSNRALWVAVSLAILVLWVNQQSHADLLMRP